MYERVKSHKWMSHVTHVTESCHSIVMGMGKNGSWWSVVSGSNRAVLKRCVYTLQRTVTDCNRLQHTATLCPRTNLDAASSRAPLTLCWKSVFMCVLIYVYVCIYNVLMERCLDSIGAVKRCVYMCVYVCTCSANVCALTCMCVDVLL